MVKLQPNEVDDPKELCCLIINIMTCSVCKKESGCLKCKRSKNEDGEVQWTWYGLDSIPFCMSCLKNS